MTIDLDAEQRAFRDTCGHLAADLAAHWTLGRGPGDVAPPLPGPAGLVEDGGRGLVRAMPARGEWRRRGPALCTPAC